MDKKVICMIPARIGSQRFKKKNLAIIQKKPILSWGIEAALNPNIFDEVIINGDDDLFEKITNSYGLRYYNRGNQNFHQVLQNLMMLFMIFLNYSIVIILFGSMQLHLFNQTKILRDL